jgi:photosystem II stability/assembly factor-like uncharacterized protein
MTVLNRFLLLGIILSLWIVPASAQGPREITALVIDPHTPTTLYAGTRTAENWSDSTDGSVYKSTDAGQSWTLVNSGMGIVHIRALAIDPKNSATVYAGTRDRGIFKTINGGQNWEPVNIGLTSLLVQALVVTPINSVVYAGTRDQGVFKSTDQGKNWEAVNDGLASLFIQALVIDPTDPETIYAGTRAGSVWRDGADFSFCQTQCLIPSFNCQVCRNSRSELSSDGVFKSVDGGRSWIAMNTGLTNRFISALAIDALNPHIVYASTDRGGIFQSTDAGRSWHTLTNGRLNPLPIPWSDVRALAIDPKNSASLFAGTWGSGIFRTVDRGQNWAEANSGLSDRYMYPNALAVDPVNPDTIYAGTTDRGVFKSTDGGASWQVPGF